jgi:small-conductance mechanosensitive channel
MTRAIALFFALLAPLAAGAVAETHHPATMPRTGVPLTIANRPIVTLYGPIAGYSAHDRVDASRRRINETLASAAHPSVTTTSLPDGTLVSIAGSPAFLVAPVDVNPDIGETTQYVAREAATRLERAIGEYREQRSPRYMLDAGLMVALATLIFVLAVYTLRRMNRAAGRRLADFAATHSKKVHLEGVNILDEARIAGAARRVVALMTVGLGLLAAYVWIMFVFELLPYTRPWGEEMEHNILSLVSQVALSIVHAVPGLAMVAIIIVATRALIGLARVFFTRVEEGKEKIGALDADTAMPTRRLVELALWLFALALSFPFLPGSHTDAFKGVSVLAGLAASIAASSVLAQAASGLHILYGRVIRRGEYIRVDDIEGKVTAIGIFATRIRTPRGEEVTVPNAQIHLHGVRNFSRGRSQPGFMLTASVSIGYATSWRQVKAMLLEAAARTSELDRDPPPFVRQTALTNFYVSYDLVTFTSTDHGIERADVFDHLNANIQDVFAEHEVQIMVPHYLADPARPQVPPSPQRRAPASSETVS